MTNTLKIVSFTSIWLLFWVVSLQLAWPTSGVSLIFCDVGQGDAILLTSGYTQVLIDAGPDSKILECLQRSIPAWDNHLELLVVTHLHTDHFGGVESVLGRWSVGKIWLSNLGNAQTKEFIAFSTAIRAASLQGTAIELPFLGRREVLQGGTELIVIGPPSLGESSQLSAANTQQNELSETILLDTFDSDADEEESQNDLSIVLFIRYNNSTALLMGDLEKQGEEALLERGLISDVDLIKVGHHGSKTSSSASFLARASPEIAVVSVGKNNQYKHPSPEVMMRYDVLGVTTYQTDRYGSIRFSASDSAWKLVNFKRKNSPLEKSTI